MTLNLGPIPKYYQLADILRRQITSGELLPGQQLPGEEALCKSYNVSRGRVRQATRLLDSSKTFPFNTFFWANETFIPISKALTIVKNSLILYLPCLFGLILNKNTILINACFLTKIYLDQF